MKSLPFRCLAGPVLIAIAGLACGQDAPVTDERAILIAHRAVEVFFQRQGAVRKVDPSKLSVVERPQTADDAWYVKFTDEAKCELVFAVSRDGSVENAGVSAECFQSGD